MTSQPVSPRHAFARRIIIDLAAMTVIGVFLAITGPFGSIGAPMAFMAGLLGSVRGC